MNHFAKITHFSRIIESAFFSELINFHSPEIICDTLRDLVPFVQFKRGENAHGGVLLKVCNCTKLNTPPWVFSTFFKLYRRYHIAQNILETILLQNWTNFRVPFCSVFGVDAKCYGELL